MIEIMSKIFRTYHRLNFSTSGKVCLIKINNYIWVLFFIILFDIFSVVYADGLFSIKSIRYYNKTTPNGCKIVKKVKNKDGGITYEHQPFIEARVSTTLRIQFDRVFAKAYFYDSTNKLLFSSKEPSVAIRPNVGTYDIPAFFEKDKTESIYFEVPEFIRNIKGWKSLVVFGDTNEISTATYPQIKISELYFNEKSILSKQGRSNYERMRTINPLIDFTLRTPTEKYPKITFILRLPKNKNIPGLCAVCLLANSIEDIKKELLYPKSSEISEIIKFADKHNLALLCWGSRPLWDRTKNWTEQENTEYKIYDKTFDEIASSWSYGVNQLCKKYNIPSDNILLWGTSGAAQFAMRLALRRPNKFLAISLHIPSSFDKPTKNGKDILWCLTTGELEPGYNRSLEFYSKCVLECDYSIIYKAIVGLGHSSSNQSTKMRLMAWEYALTQKTHRKEKTWKDLLCNSNYYGDIINQRVVSRDKAEELRNILLTPLPDKTLKEIWEIDIVDTQ